MPDKSRFFIKIMKIELESLEDDVRNLEEILEKRHSERTVSNYVFQENRVTLIGEFSCLKKLVEVMDDFPLLAGEEIDHLKNRFLDFVRDYCRDNDYPEAVFRLVDSRVQKAVLYLL